jgi:hypothetical protein
LFKKNCHCGIDLLGFADRCEMTAIIAERDKFLLLRPDVDGENKEQ